MTITVFSEIIIGLGACVMAIWNILRFIKAGDDKVKELSDNKFDERLEEKLPEYFNTHPDIVQNIVQEFSLMIDDKFRETNINNEKIQVSLNNITNKLDSLKESNDDILRREINRIYAKYKDYKKIPQYDKSDCAKFMEDYGGNSYVEDLWVQIRTWEVVESEDDIGRKK